MRIEEDTRQWYVVVVYILFIYLTLPLMRPFLSLLYDTFGKENLNILVNSLIAGSVILLSARFFMKEGREGYLRFLQGLPLMLAGVVMGAFVELPEERMHFLEYGILGWLVWRASVEIFSRPYLLSVSFVSIVGGGDEFIQWLLPDRVGELRDVIFNALGGFIGASVAKVWDRR